jgi:hypothetical protein
MWCARFSESLLRLLKGLIRDLKVRGYGPDLRGRASKRWSSALLVNLCRSGRVRGGSSVVQQAEIKGFSEADVIWESHVRPEEGAGRVLAVPRGLARTQGEAEPTDGYGATPATEPPLILVGVKRAGATVYAAEGGPLARTSDLILLRAAECPGSPACRALERSPIENSPPRSRADRF